MEVAKAPEGPLSPLEGSDFLSLAARHLDPVLSFALRGLCHIVPRDRRGLSGKPAFRTSWG